MRRGPSTVLVAVALALGVTGCGSDDSGSGPGSAASPTAATPALSGDITVLAAASLTETFAELGEQFEAANSGTDVTFSFAASSALATQIGDGAPADVFASASQKTMDDVVGAGAASDPTVFARNVMQIATPPGNPANVASVDDLADSSVKTALCQPRVPCGEVAEQVLANANVTVQPVTLEPDVRSVLSKVQLGEVDAGIVYVTDVKAAGDKVEGVPIPDIVNASTDYPIASLAGSANAAAASAFVDLVLSPAGQSVLSAAGFQAP